MALSKTQSKRLGAILSVMFNEEAPSEVIDEIIKQGYVQRNGDALTLTEKGNDERNRLSTLAGLNIKYRSERLRDEAILANKSADLSSNDTGHAQDIESKSEHTPHQ